MDDETMARKLADDIEFKVVPEGSLGVDNAETWGTEKRLICAGGVLTVASITRAAAAIRENYGRPAELLLSIEDKIYLEKYAVFGPDGQVSRFEDTARRIAADVQFHFGIGLPKGVWEKLRKDNETFVASLVGPPSDDEETPVADEAAPKPRPFIDRAYTGELDQIVKNSRAEVDRLLGHVCYFCLWDMSFAAWTTSGRALSNGACCCGPCYGRYVNPVGE